MLLENQKKTVFFYSWTNEFELVLRLVKQTKELGLSDPYVSECGMFELLVLKRKNAAVALSEGDLVSNKGFTIPSLVNKAIPSLCK